MAEEIPNRCIERGEGYACWMIELPQDQSPIVEPAKESATFENATFDTQLVYHPVNVEINENGEAYAYYWDSLEDGEIASRGKNAGKRYVQPQYVHSSPLPNAEPAYKYEEKKPPKQ